MFYRTARPVARGVLLPKSLTDRASSPKYLISYVPIVAAALLVPATGCSGTTAAESPDDGDAAAVSIEKRAKGQLGQLLSSAQGESVQAAVVSGSNPVECEVYLNNELAGYYKGRDAGHLERNVKYRLEEVGKKMEVRVVPVVRQE